MSRNSKRAFVLVVILSLISTNAAEQSASTLAVPPPVTMTAREDHQRTMHLLGIDKLRPGRNGSNPQATNAANYDETKADPFPKLPDPLIAKDGSKITTPKQWWGKRRPEIFEDFAREVYGRVPKKTPNVRWEVTETTRGTNGEIPTVTKKLIGRVDNASYPAVEVNISMSLTTPADAKEPVPVMLQFGFDFSRFFNRTNSNRPNATRTNRFGPPAWQKDVLSRGWAYAVLFPNSVQEDNGGGLTRGIIGLVNKGQPRKLDDWGALAAWGWGASRALDYFETDPAVDAKRVGIEGHSRYGKASLVAMALDPRIAIGYISSSGAGGAKLHRRDFGEIVENVAAPSEYHWMAGNYLKYAGPLTWDDLPVDSHQLIALCAPRPVFIGAGTVERGDGWVDAKGSFLAAVGAGPVYRLLGKKDLGATEFPKVETTLMDGDLAFRQHAGGHTDGPNWPVFLDFTERYFKKGRD